jgi:hypothetical protein
MSTRIAVNTVLIEPIISRRSVVIFPFSRGRLLYTKKYNILKLYFIPYMSLKHVHALIRTTGRVPFHLKKRSLTCANAQKTINIHTFV